MTFIPLKIDGVWLHKPRIFSDERGSFLEAFKSSSIENEVGRPFQVKQVNQSTSARGSIRGVHWTNSAEGQAKYVSCPKGAIWDVVVDFRKESETYLQWDAQILSQTNGYSLLISEGIGHAFMALETDSVANYLCTSEYNPEADKTVFPFDETINIPFKEIAINFGITEFILSEKDRAGLKVFSEEFSQTVLKFK